MTEGGLSKVWLKNKGHKLKVAYSYAVVNKLNINSKEDVLKILQSVDPESATIDQAEIYMKMLQLFKSRFRKTMGELLE